jgi:hypothetical protein
VGPGDPREKRRVGGWGAADGGVGRRGASSAAERPSHAAGASPGSCPRCKRVAAASGASPGALHRAARHAPCNEASTTSLPVPTKSTVALCGVGFPGGSGPGREAVDGAVPAALQRRSAPRGGLDRGGVVERTAGFEAGHAEPAPTVTGCLGTVRAP